MKKIKILLAGAALCTTTIVSGQNDKDEKMPPMSKEQMATMKAWEAYATPGNEQKELAMDNGQWDEATTSWMAPGAPPMQNKMVAVNTMILGGRYQQSVHRGEFDGQPFEGISTVGFDNVKKKYISTWIDNMGTGIMIMEGSYDPKTKSINLKGKQVDPVSGKELEMREIFTMVDDNTRKMEMFQKPLVGKEFKTMEIIMTRKK
jgi:hypothetical protein